MLTMPGDVPRATATDIAQVLGAHPQGAAFTIVPAWDERGSNASSVHRPIRSPCGLVLTVVFRILRRHARWLEPAIVRNDAIALDLDEPADLARFMDNRSQTRTFGLLDERRAAWQAPSMVGAQ